MEIRFTRGALSDLYGIYDYIAKTSPDYAAKTLTRIETAIDNLSDHPQLGRTSRNKAARELIISGTPYIVAYTRDTEYLNIISIIHSSRKGTVLFH